MLRWFKRKEPEEPARAAVAEPPARGAAATPPAEGLFARLRQGLGKTHSALVGALRSAVRLNPRLDEELIQEVEEALLQADVGVRSADRVLGRLRREVPRGEPLEMARLLAILKDSIAEMLEKDQRPPRENPQGPTIWLFVGVNGTGKTTTIGKMALELSRHGRSAMMVAADTFRAAAVDQLAIWAERTGACLASGREGADPASVCFEGLKAARDGGVDFVLIDTAGRLHTKAHLMEELGKVVRVIRKVYPEAPQEIILVLDATIGQNALAQVATFRQAVGLTGLIMTKLDGTARGGILIAVKEAHPDLPIFKIGVGEAAEDLRDFVPAEFAAALLARD